MILYGEAVAQGEGTHPRSPRELETDWDLTPQFLASHKNSQIVEMAEPSVLSTASLPSGRQLAGHARKVVAGFPTLCRPWGLSTGAF